MALFPSPCSRACPQEDGCRALLGFIVEYEEDHAREHREHKGDHWPWDTRKMNSPHVYGGTPSKFVDCRGHGLVDCLQSLKDCPRRRADCRRHFLVGHVRESKTEVLHLINSLG